MDRREARDRHRQAADGQHAGDADRRDPPGAAERHRGRLWRRRLGKPRHPDRQDRQRGEGDADQRRFRRRDIDRRQHGIADAEPGDIGDVEHRHHPAANGVGDGIVEPALGDDEQAAYGKAVKRTRRDPQQRIGAGANGGVGQRNQRRQHHERARMPDPAHQRPGQDAAGKAAGRKAGDDQPGPGRIEALDAEADRDIGKHQPIADRDQRHRQRRRWQWRSPAPAGCHLRNRLRVDLFIGMAMSGQHRPARRTNAAAKATWPGGLAQSFAALRMALDDSDERGPWMKVQAGAFMRASLRRVALVDAGIVEGLGDDRGQEGQRRARAGR